MLWKGVKGRPKSQSYPDAPPLDFKTTSAELDPVTFPLKGKEEQRKGNFPSLCLLSSSSFFLLLFFFSSFFFFFFLRRQSSIRHAYYMIILCIPFPYQWYTNPFKRWLEEAEAVKSTRYKKFKFPSVASGMITHRLVCVSGYLALRE